MKILGKLEKELLGLQNILFLCLKHKDITHSDYRSMEVRMKKVGDIVLNRKERD